MSDQPTTGVNEPDTVKPDRWTTLPPYDDEYRERCPLVEYRTYDWQRVFAEYRFRPVKGDWRILNREFGISIPFTNFSTRC